ncbi:MAG: (E)-4-hydroxy-3-methylbut-2-enyl-diphosphate synthase [Bacteroidetes bacterium]|nr:(E)-4-hydroxy-3-methylbut-2-enyl-diphosphate synthase [Bacteroidota bacterium]
MIQFEDLLFGYERLETREVSIGGVVFGGKAPLRVQSMTTADTMNTEATVEESIRMIEAGCELVRITAPSKNEAENLAVIQEELRKRGYTTPIVADIHFTPNAAEIASRIVAKVRVNPGNYADKKKFEEIVYTNETYQAELKRIEERFLPLVRLCKENGTAMRIGTNHGSLSDRILSRYGDTPEGMVESAMEFIRICEKENFFNLVVSMKASNPQVMVYAYRLLVKEFLKHGRSYPLHLGVTEAGDGEDGRIKSAVGIGALLEDGIGDTVRVSLTEAPEAEMPVARSLVNRYSNRKKEELERVEVPISLFEFNKRNSVEVGIIGGKNVPRVIADYSNKESITPASLFAVGYRYSVELDKFNITDSACDFIYIGDNSIDFEIPGTLGVIQEYDSWEKNKDRHFPLFDWKRFQEPNVRSDKLNFVRCTTSDLNAAAIENLKQQSHVVVLLSTEKESALQDLRATFFRLIHANYVGPVIVERAYALEEELYMLYASTDIGGLFLDGLGDGVFISNASAAAGKSNELAFGILQATRSRISKTEYISCPSCGRTLFDLQETTAKIRSRTSHLKGIKIGIMGCIVNGPGEMADADYGYVGTGVGKITLYKEKNVVKKNVNEEEAVDELIALIQEHGDWVEPQQVD